MIRSICIFMFGMWFCICGCSQISNANFDDMVIYKAGEYVVDGQKLIVSFTKDKLVDYRLLDASGVEILRSSERASALQRWELYWESVPARLWFNSSDVGCFVWQKNIDSIFVRSEVTAETKKLITQMPNSVFLGLPSSLQKQWALLRSK